MAEYFDNDAIRDRISSYIDKQGLTASAFADQAGISRSTLSNILAGKSQITLPTLNRIIETYSDCNPDWLLLGLDSAVDEGGDTLFSPAKPAENRFLEKELTECREKLTQQNTELELLHTKLKELEARHQKTVDKIMVFYSDSSFETYILKK